MQINWSDEPKIKPQYKVLDPLKWDTDSEIILPPALSLPSMTLSSVLEKRTTTREFDAVSVDLLGSFLYHSLRVRAQVRHSNGSLILKKQIISSGSLHSINCLVSMHNTPNQWFYYDGIRHSLNRIRTINDQLHMVSNKARADIPRAGKSTILWYICDFERLSSKYEEPESLAYRDCGAILSTQSLVAENFNLSFCPLGITGATESRSLQTIRNVKGVGLALLGQRS